MDIEELEEDSQRKREHPKAASTTAKLEAQSDRASTDVVAAMFPEKPPQPLSLTAPAASPGIEPSARLTAAIDYARRGWPVLPLHYMTGNRCSCGKRECSSPAKHPLTGNGFKDATTSEDTIRVWWTRWPTANIGIRTGSVSGVIVIDVDDRTAMPALAAVGAIPKTLRVRTGKGLHIYFGAPTQPIRPRTALIPGIDVRGDDSYVVAPPSVHASGRRYAFDRVDATIAAMPDWLSNLITASTRMSGGRSESVVFTQGQRNTRLTCVGGSMVRQGIVGGPLEAILEATNQEACEPPLPKDEVRQVARSVERYATSPPPPLTSSWSRTRRLLKLYSVNDVLTEPSQQWRVEGLLPVEALSMIYSPQAQFKTFFALDLALCVANGIPFHGRRVKQGPVIYILGEGRGGLKNRIAAWLLKHDVKDVEQARFALEAIQFKSADDVSALKSVIEAQNMRPAMLFIDTFARSAVGVDENDAMQMGVWIDAVTTLKMDLGCDVVTVHHAQKPRPDGGTVRERGSSAFIGAVDTVVRLARKTKTSKTVTISCEKQKDAEEFTDFKLRAKDINLGINEHGESFSSVVLIDCDGDDDAVVESDLTLPNASQLSALQVLSDARQLGSAAWLQALSETRGTPVPEGTFRHWREALVKGRFVEKVGSRYQLTDGGHAIVGANGRSLAALENPSEGASHATHPKGVADGTGRVEGNGRSPARIDATGDPSDDPNLLGGGGGEPI